VRGLQERGAVAALSRPGRLAVTAVAATVVVAADQVTKAVAVAQLHRPVHLVGPFGLDLGYNTGSAFSLFTADAPVVTAVAVVLVGVLGWLAWRAPSVPVAVAVGLVLGGALGNLVDRIVRGRVVDFITLTHWPTFNLADGCITVGVILLVVFYWHAASPARRPQSPGSQSPGPR